MTIPPILYKYSSRRGTNILRDRKIKITPPDELNDPLDSHPRFQISPTGPLGTLFSALTPGEQDDFLREKELSWRSQMSTHLRFFCLSADPANPLMWSHYADHHRGIVLGFDSSYWVHPDRSILPVDYSSDIRPVIDLANVGDDPAKAYWVKSKHWAHEEEYRVGEDFTVAGHESGDPVLVDIPPSIIVRVIVGAFTPSFVVMRLVRLLAKSEYSHLKLERVEFDRHRFLLRPVPLELVFLNANSVRRKCTRPKAGH